MQTPPFTTISIAVVVIIAYLSLAQFVGLPYWRPDISSVLGLSEYLILSLSVIGLVSLARRERNRTRRSAET